jgi:hypothetical protein
MKTDWKRIPVFEPQRGRFGTLIPEEEGEEDDDDRTRVRVAAAAAARRLIRMRDSS